jgi:hypothetical protein
MGTIFHRRKKLEKVYLIQAVSDETAAMDEDALFAMGSEALQKKCSIYGRYFRQVKKKNVPVVKRRITIKSEDEKDFSHSLLKFTRDVVETDSDVAVRIAKDIRSTLGLDDYFFITCGMVESKQLRWGMQVYFLFR